MSLVVTLNDEPTDLNLDGVIKLSDLMDLIRDRHLHEGDLIIRIVVDDQERDKNSGDPDLAGLASVAIYALKEPRQKAAALLGGMADYLVSLESGLSEVADAFRMGGAADANRLLMSALDGLSSLTELVESVQALVRFDITLERFTGMTLEERSSATLKVLTDINNAQEQKDWIKVADLLEYELAPVVAGWREIMPQLQGALTREDN